MRIQHGRTLEETNHTIEFRGNGTREAASMTRPGRPAGGWEQEQTPAKPASGPNWRFVEGIISKLESKSVNLR